MTSPFTDDELRAMADAPVSVEHQRRLARELLEARRDARRYRWLKANKAFRIPEHTDYWGLYSTPVIKGVTLDAAIDSAIAGGEVP